MMNPRSVVASGFLTLALLGGCPSPSRTQQLREPATPPAPSTPKSAAAPLSAPAANTPRHPVTEGRLIDSGLIIEAFAEKFGRRELKQVPSVVIETGILRYVPYLSYEAAQGELNIYGDPQHPAGVEIGLYAGKNSTKEEIRNLMAGLLQQAADRELVHDLALEQDKLERAGLTFEITPPTADDGFGGWWISIYDKKALDAARRSDAELKEIVVEVPAGKEENPARPKPTKAKKPARKPSEPQRVYVEDYDKKDGAPVRPAL
jgi:hypothetical protein